MPPLLLHGRVASDDDLDVFEPGRGWLFAVDPEHPGSAPLPGLQALARDLGKHLAPRVTLTGDAVTPERFLRDLASSGAVLYAGHAEYDHAHPLRSALLLAPSAETPSGRLDARTLLGERRPQPTDRHCSH